MANLSESSTFDAGVYQIETTDPVQGGAAGATNTPLKALVNRTRWLKDTLDAVVLALTGYAPINTPVFTGNPQAPTPALDDSDASLATTSFVKGVVAGVLTKNVAGGVNVTLTAAEAGSGTIVLTGAITANISVIVPAVAAKWVIRNSTTGAFTLTVKTAAGTGVAVTQGVATFLYCDGTNVALASVIDLATALKNGLLSLEDKIKLDALPANVVNRAGDTMTGRLKTLSQSEAVATPSITGGILTLDLSQANVFRVSLNANISTLTISNPPASGTDFAFTLIFTADGTSRSVAWPASAKHAKSTPPVLTIASGKKDRFVFETADAGAEWLVSPAGQNF